MGKAVLLYENFADNAVLSGGSWLSSLPLSRVQNEDPRAVARSSSASDTDTVIIADLGKERSVGGVALGPINLSPGASFRIRGFNDALLETAVFDGGVTEIAGSVIDWTDTAEWLEWEDSNFWTGVDEDTRLPDLPVYAFSFVSNANVAIARYWKIEIFDEGNADGYLDVGRLYIGRALHPAYNYSYGDNSFGIEPLTDTQESLGGKRTFWRRAHRRVWRGTFQYLPETQLFGDVLRMASQSGIDRQVFLCIDPDDDETGQQRAFLGTLKTIPSIQQSVFARGTTAFDIEEAI